MKFLFAALFPWLLGFGGATAAADCTTASLHFRLGVNPYEVSYRLVCDQKTVWKAHQLKLPFNHGNLVHTESKCLQDAKSCTLLLYNTDRALTKKRIHTTYAPPEAVELIVGGKQVFRYDGSSDFYKQKSRSFCVGDECPKEVSKKDDQCIATSLQLKLDEFPGETGYRLQCEDTVFWYKPKWHHLVSSGWSFQTLNEEACVPEDSCCSFQIEDHWGDGITSRQEYRPGSFKLLYDKQVVAKYNGAKHGSFSKLEFKFGKCKTIVCIDVDLAMTLDQFPYETGYSLQCDGNPIWDVPVHTFMEASEWAFRTITEKTCVSPSACCKFVVHDTWGDGITASENDRQGTFQLVFGDDTVAAYDGTDEYDQLEFDFGAC